jgi:transposase
MSEKELDRVAVMGRVSSGELKLVDGARLLGVGYRQAIRIRQKYEEQGPRGLQHGNAGKPSHNRKPEGYRQEILQLVQEHYSGPVGERFGPTLAAQHLERDHGRRVPVETLRRWMQEQGLWSRARKRQRYRKRRERKQHFGELVQLDGSHHAWLEQRGPRGCLMVMVDDATGECQARLGAQETIWAAVGVLRCWIERYGVPLALYVDWKNVYVRGPNAQERVSGEEPMTQFGRMCAKLGIRIIAASSPQAKGRVERAHGTHQDRLVKKLRLQNIATYQEANRFLAQEYLGEHNRQFHKAAARREDYHRPAPSPEQLRQIFRLEQERKISNDWVVRYGKRVFQLQRQSSSYAPARGTVTVCEWEDGRVKIEYRGQELAWEEIAVPVKRLNYSEQPVPAQGSPARPKRVKNIPVAEHPWRRQGKKDDAVREQERAFRRWRNNSLAAVPSSASP